VRTTRPPGRSRGRHTRPGPVWLANLRTIVSIVLPLVLAWALLPASAKPGGSGSRNLAAAEPASDALWLGQLVNAERAHKGLPRLEILPRLSAVAGAQAARMAARHRLGATPGLDRAVQPASAWAENVLCAPTVEQAHRALLNSPARRARILSRSFNALGVGAAPGGCVWVAEVFARVTEKAAAPAPGRPATTSPSTTSTTRPATTTSRPPRTTVPATSAPGGGQATAEKLAQDLFARLNAERRARGQAELGWDADLARMAADWSAQMARTGNFTHRDLGAAGSLPGMSRFSALGENIAWVEGYANDGYQLHLGWMRSEGHRANLLQPGFDRVGVGVVCAGGRAWATQNFGRLDGSDAPPMTADAPSEEPIVATRLDGVRC
jgi:uncharacterized protein YkwD